MVKSITNSLNPVRSRGPHDHQTYAMCSGGENVAVAVGVGESVGVADGVGESVGVVDGSEQATTNHRIASTRRTLVWFVLLTSISSGRRPLTHA